MALNIELLLSEVFDYACQLSHQLLKCRAQLLQSPSTGFKFVLKALPGSLSASLKEKEEPCRQ
jgi:hypothetical protein